MSLEVLRPGPLALVQDAGRPGLAALGVSPSGAFDRDAFRRGMGLVGNDPAAAALELVLGGLVVRALDAHVVALTGAACRATVDGVPVPWDARVRLAAGQVLSLALPERGLRSYLSVAGGIDVPAVLGSRSSDLLSGLGPAKLAAGDVLPVAVPLPGELPGEARARQRHDDPIPGVLPDEARARHRREGPPTLFLLPGPRRDWLADPAALAGAWVVSPDSNRVGVRLSGRSLGRAREHAGAELPAEPLVRGAVQLPPSGLPVLFGPDHPTTGGYPVVAVLTEESCDRLAQCRPGDPVVLRWRG